jgi:hypothetical protein
MTKLATVHAQQMWEYHCTSRTTETYLVHELNTLGGAGWELISTTQHKNVKGALVWTAFLKRPYVGPKPEKADSTRHELAAAEPNAHPAEETTTSPGFDLSETDFEVKD